ncbi:MAG: hypothetical protein Q8S54_11685 [Bacteroidota bacterium]|nr:hypothetical protein [Bacteroidota bacterium]
MARDYFKEFREAKADNNFGTIEKLYFELCGKLDIVDETATGNEGARIAELRNAQAKGEGEFRGKKI